MGILIKNSIILTQNEGREVLRGDVLIEGSRIENVAGRIQEKAEFTIDGDGKLLLPGFVNAHTHVAMTLLRGYADDMELGEWLNEKIRPLEKKMRESDVRAGSLLGCAEMIRGGTTSFNDMYFFMPHVAKAVEESGMRALLAYGMVEGGDDEKGKMEVKIGEEFVREFNGKAGGRIRCAFGPHAPYACSSALLKKIDGLSKKYKVPIHSHISETRKEVFDMLKKEKKRPVEYLEHINFLSKRLIAAHCGWITKREVKILAEKGVSVAHCPVSNMKLAVGGVSPIPEMLEEGVNVSLGTDGSASNNSLSMLETMKICSLLQKHQRWDPTSINAQQALDFATRNGARALGINAGSIEKGKLADIILIDAKAPNMAPLHNPISQLVYSANAGNVTDVIIDGKIVMRERKMQTINEEKVVEEAQKAAIDLVTR
jgi:5-methylthioadenosine/S-adenosylhomocysteine deaminase